MLPCRVRVKAQQQQQLFAFFSLRLVSSRYVPLRSAVTYPLRDGLRDASHNGDVAVTSRVVDLPRIAPTLLPFALPFTLPFGR